LSSKEPIKTSSKTNKNAKKEWFVLYRVKYLSWAIHLIRHIAHNTIYYS
jgi:hypothetical protein